MRVDETDVLHCDAQLLVVNKPPGVLSQPDRTGDADIAALGKAFLREHEGAGEDPFLAPAHRLDRPAGGVMALARTSEAARHLARQFRERTVDKRYLAVVEGEGAGFGALDDYIAKTDATPRLTDPDDPDGRWARLQYQSLAEHDGLGLLLVRPETGRPHQIRLQLAERGVPILGDLRYGAERELDGQNLALHSYRLAVEHPAEERRVSFSAPPPATWPQRFGDDIERVMRNA
jgi:tRNA pseudouridine32 synthase/23S rRNA pseudouridine746 synthase/23S rRNA pseudouridine1911/1915/1917 synthase